MKKRYKTRIDKQEQLNSNKSHLLQVGDVHPAEFLVEKQVDFVAVIGPRAEGHVAELLVEWEVRDVHAAWAVVYSMRDPQHRAVVRYDNQYVSL